MSSQNKKFISPAMHSSINRLIQKSNLTPSVADQSGGPESPAQGNSVITCILHGNINNPVDMVDCTRLAIIQDRGTKKAWQVVVNPSISISFSLIINSVTVGPFASTTTGTSAFQNAVTAAIPTDTPRCWVVHGNFFVYPAASVSFSADVEGDIYQVPWMPLVGTGFKTRVGTRRLAKSAQFLRGSTQAAEWVHGYGYAIASAAGESSSDEPLTGGCCDCISIDKGDIEVGGIETTSIWQAELSAVKYRQEFGALTVKAGLYELIWDAQEEYWVYDFKKKDLSVAFLSGDDAAGFVNLGADGDDGDDDPVITARAILRRDDGGFTTFKITINGTIPNQNEVTP